MAAAILESTRERGLAQGQRSDGIRMCFKGVLLAFQLNNVEPISVSVSSFHLIAVVTDVKSTQTDMLGDERVQMVDCVDSLVSSHAAMSVWWANRLACANTSDHTNDEPPEGRNAVLTLAQKLF